MRTLEMILDRSPIYKRTDPRYILRVNLKWAWMDFKAAAKRFFKALFECMMSVLATLLLALLMAVVLFLIAG